MTITWTINKGELDLRFGPKALGPEYNSIGFPPAWDNRPWIAANFVADQNGLVVGDNIIPEHLLGITSLEGQRLEPDSGREADQRLMRDLRVRANAVMWGANTLRRQPTIIPDLQDDATLHNLRTSLGFPYYPPLILVTDSGNLDFSLKAFHTDNLRTIVLTNETTAQKLQPLSAGTKAEIIGIGNPNLNMSAALERLRKQEGMRRVICEGGHKLIVSLRREGGFLDEVFVTTSNVAIDPALVQNPKYMFKFEKEGAELIAFGKAGKFEFRRWRFNKRS